MHVENNPGDYIGLQVGNYFYPDPKHKHSAVICRKCRKWMRELKQDYWLDDKIKEELDG